jgi:hypothetical protein
MKNTLIVVIIMLAMQTAYSDRVLTVDLEVYKNDSVDVRSIKVEEANPTFYMPTGDYILQIKDKNGRVIFKKNIGLNYISMSDPPKPLDHSPLYISINYVKGMNHIEL